MLSSSQARQKRKARHPQYPGQKPASGLPTGVDWQLAAAVALLAVACWVALGVYVYPRLWIAPGVRSLGVDLGGKTRGSAGAALQHSWQTRTIVLVDQAHLREGEGLLPVAPGALGLGLDVDATVKAAFVRGRSWEELGARLRGDRVLDVPPVLVVDVARAAETLQALRPQIDVPPANAGLRLVDGRVEAVEPQPGRSLDVAETLARLEERPLAAIEVGRLDLMVDPVLPLAIDLSAAVAEANEWLAHTLSVVGYDPILDETLTWNVAPEQWVAWVSMAASPAVPTQVNWTFDRQAAAVALGTWASSLGEGRNIDEAHALLAVERAIMEKGWHVRLRVYHSPSLHWVQSGETLSSISRMVGIPYPWIEQANPGVSDSLSVGQVLTIPSPDVLLPLPVVEHKRIVVSLAQQRMWAYENGALLWEWPVSTGIDSSPTAPGVFQIQSHDPNAYASSWNLWMPYFMGIYRPVPTSSFMNGFHGFPTRDGASLLWTGNLGYPVTYGCILLGHTSAPLLYEWAEEGVVVEIRE